MRVYSLANHHLTFSNLRPSFSFPVYLLLGLVFMTLTATVYYDIPQLNLGLVLHQHKDIHIPSETASTTNGGGGGGSDTERTSLKSSFKGFIAKGSRKISRKSNGVGEHEDIEE